MLEIESTPQINLFKTHYYTFNIDKITFYMVFLHFLLKIA